MRYSNLIAGFLIAIGITIAGYFISTAYYKGKKLDRFVTVKGLAEREVLADLAIWPITITEASNNLMELNTALKTKTETVNQFLTAQGFDKSETSINPPSIIDTKAERYGNRDNPYRYLGSASLTIRTNNIPTLKKAFTAATALIEQGVVISQNDYQNRIQYLYTKLNDIKPAMIEEATKEARQAADKFAQDSGSKVGTIKQATQGLFSISDRDMNSPDIKNIRVVTTVEYYLVDE